MVQDIARPIWQVKQRWTNSEIGLVGPTLLNLPDRTGDVLDHFATLYPTFFNRWNRLYISYRVIANISYDQSIIVCNHFIYTIINYDRNIITCIRLFYAITNYDRNIITCIRLLYTITNYDKNIITCIRYISYFVIAIFLHFSLSLPEIFLGNQ